MQTMENDTDGVIVKDPPEESSHPQSDPMAEVEEILRQAGLEEDSDTEYLSAEEDSESESAEIHEKTDSPKVDSHNVGDLKFGTKEDIRPDEGDSEEEAAEKNKLAIRQKEEDSLTPEEKEERQVKGQNLKADGNTKFRDGDYDGAKEAYTEALEICPLNFLKERAIMFANRAACEMKKEEFDEAIKDSTCAIELHPQYLKALRRRAELYEKTEKLDEALKDYEKIVEMDPSQHAARAACIRLAEQIKERNEKMKEEMIGKLKDLGNLVLRPFGLNVNNFNLQQDPNTGSYSVQFRQNPTGNGS